MGLGIEFIVAQWKKEEIQEGYLVTGLLIPMIVPVGCPLWMLAPQRDVVCGTRRNVSIPSNTEWKAWSLPFSSNEGRILSKNFFIMMYDVCRMDGPLLYPLCLYGV